MAATPTYTEVILDLGQKKTNHLIEKCCYESALQFKRILRNSIRFHLGFFALFFLETLLFTCFLSAKVSPYLLPIVLSSIFLSVFSYLVLLYYFQAKKPEQFMHVKNSFLSLCKQTFDIHTSSTDYHLSLASAFEKLATFLDKQTLESSKIKRMRFLAKKEIRSMQEILILESIKEHITLIKMEPTDLEAHASLALTYLTLAKIHKPTSEEGKNREYITAIERGIEELKILKDYVPTDPWVHAQLASCYHDLDKHQDEIQEYEMILQLRPEDREIMYRLGILYFQQGQIAKGLKAYDQLRSYGYKKADHLLHYYDAYTKSIFPNI